MVILFKVTVAASGVPGPLLGDGTKSTVTMLLPSTLTDTDQLPSNTRTSVVNQSTRAHYAVARLGVYALRANTNDVFFGAKGSASANMIPLQNAQGLPPIGFGDRNDIDLYDFDIDVTTSGEGFLIVAEMR